MSMHIVVENTFLLDTMAAACMALPAGNGVGGRAGGSDNGSYLVGQNWSKEVLS